MNSITRRSSKPSKPSGRPICLASSVRRIATHSCHFNAGWDLPPPSRRLSPSLQTILPRHREHLLRLKRSAAFERHHCSCSLHQVASSQPSLFGQRGIEGDFASSLGVSPHRRLGSTAAVEAAVSFSPNHPSPSS
jgi:hypothetical protein